MGRPSRAVNPVIGDRIKEARKSIVIDGKRMTQEMLAQKLYVSCQAVKNWEQHINEPDIENLKSIAHICNVNVYWLSGFYDDVQNFSRSMLDSFLPEQMKEHDELANLLLQVGYDLAILEIENSNIAEYIKHHIAGRDKDELKSIILECMADYEMLKNGFRR